MQSSSAAKSQPSSSAALPSSLVSMLDRLAMGMLTALLVARPLVAGDDAARLRLTSGAGTLTLNVLTFVLLAGWVFARLCTRRSVHLWDPVVLGLLLLGGWTYAASQFPDRYAHPGRYLAWEWGTAATLFFLVRRLAPDPRTARGLAAVLIASAVSVSTIGFYDEAARYLGLPSSTAEPPLLGEFRRVGDNEFAVPYHAPAPTYGSLRGSFDRPASLGAYVLLFAPGALILVWCAWRSSWFGRVAAIVPVVLIFAVVATWALHLSNDQLSISRIGQPWGTLSESPGTGIGPGNYSRRSADGAVSPENFWAGLGRTTGIVALILLPLVLVIHDRQRAKASRVETDNSMLAPLPRPRWEFYHGAIAGSVLGLILSSGDLPIESSHRELLRLGLTAAIRSLIWFLIFGLLESVPWNGRWASIGLMMGLHAVAVLGLVSDSLANAAVQQTFWVVAAVTLGLVGSSATADSLPPRRSVFRLVPAGIALILLVGYGIHCAVPGWRTAIVIRESRLPSAEVGNREMQIFDKTGAQRVLALRRTDDYLVYYVLEPLRRAVRLDSKNVELHLELSRWLRLHRFYLWRLEDHRGANQSGNEALHHSEMAARIDPRNPSGKLATFEVVLGSAIEDKVERRQRIPILEKLIQEIARLDSKREVQLRYRLMEVLLAQGVTEEIERHAVTLLRLSRVVGAPHGSLTTEERFVLEARLRNSIIPSRELLELLMDE